MFTTGGGRKNKNNKHANGRDGDGNRPTPLAALPSGVRGRAKNKATPGKIARLNSKNY